MAVTTYARARTPGKITRTSLERAALFRLERRALTEAQLRRALQGKVRRADKVHGPCADAAGWIDDVIARCTSAGLLDDARVANGKARALRERGLSKRMVLSKLKQKGIVASLAEAALAQVDDDQARTGVAELEAAIAYVRRRRLGTKDRNKALAALARQGFAFDVAKRALAET